MSEDILSQFFKLSNQTSRYIPKCIRIPYNVPKLTEAFDIYKVTTVIILRAENGRRHRHNFNDINPSSNDLL